MGHFSCLTNIERLVEIKFRFLKKSLPDFVVNNAKSNPVSNNIILCNGVKNALVRDMVKSRCVLIKGFARLLLSEIETTTLKRNILPRITVIVKPLDDLVDVFSLNSS